MCDRTEEHEQHYGRGTAIESVGAIINKIYENNISSKEHGVIITTLGKTQLTSVK